MSPAWVGEMQNDECGMQNERPRAAPFPPLILHSSFCILHSYLAQEAASCRDGACFDHHRRQEAADATPQSQSDALLGIGRPIATHFAIAPSTTALRFLPICAYAASSRLASDTRADHGGPLNPLPLSSTVS